MVTKNTISKNLVLPIQTQVSQLELNHLDSKDSQAVTLPSISTLQPKDIRSILPQVNPLTIE